MSAPHSRGRQLIVVAKVLSKIRGTTNLSFGKYLSTNHLYLFIFSFNLKKSYVYDDVLWIS